MRKTNVSESLHSKLNKTFYTPHPNIFQLVDVKNKFQCDVCIKLRSSDLKNRRRELIENEPLISNIMSQ